MLSLVCAHKDEFILVDGVRYMKEKAGCDYDIVWKFLGGMMLELVGVGVVVCRACKDLMRV